MSKLCKKFHPLGDKMKLWFGSGAVLLVSYFLLRGSPLLHQSPRYVKLADQITAKAAKKFYEEKKLKTIGTGGRMMRDIQMMAMSFFFYEEVDLAKAREIATYAVKEYLAAINADPEIKPYLHDDPFTTKNVGIRIWFSKPDGRDLPWGKIHYVSSLDGTINYYIQVGENSRKAICTETYEQALQKVSSRL